MRYRQLGSTPLVVSELGFGCGAVGGLLVRGERNEMVRTVARAMERGVTYFDTARIYGDGKSEENLGAVLEELDGDVVVGTKVQLRPEEMADMASGVFASVEGSLRRLRRESVDLIQLHNRLGPRTVADRGIVGDDDLHRVIDAFRRLAEQDKVRFWGINGLGETESLHRAVREAGAHTIQCPYNLLNPSAGREMTEGFPFQNYERLIDRAEEQGMGVIAIRVLAAGALSGLSERDPVAAPSVAPIATGQDYAQDVALAQRFRGLVRGGDVESLVEAAIRFAISKRGISTALVGISSLAQLEEAVACVEKGPMSQVMMDQVEPVWTEMGRTDGGEAS